MADLPAEGLAAEDIILETRGLSKAFKRFLAVNDVSLRVRRGSIHALIGPNGAGKTTTFNLLTKFHSPTRGSILFNGQDITGEAPAQIARRGVVRSFQISAVFPHMSVLENVRIALQRKLGVSFHFWRSGRVLDQLNGQAMSLLEAVDLAKFADLTTVELPYGRKRALELATTLALDPEMMLLDEPMAGMGHEDVGRVTELIRKRGRLFGLIDLDEIYTMYYFVFGVFMAGFLLIYRTIHSRSVRCSSRSARTSHARYRSAMTSSASRWWCSPCPRRSRALPGRPRRWCSSWLRCPTRTGTCPARWC